jgi:hypothetical protein
MSCPVCFNAAASDETVRTSLNLGIFVLMGVTAIVLAGFVRFIASIVRLSAADLKVRLSENDVRKADLKVRLYENDGPNVEAGLQARLQI